MNDARQPNIILINCDDLGYGDLGCYGSTKNATPHLDRMAKQGMRFTDHHVSSPFCSASRSSLLTGCYYRRLGFPNVLFPGDAEGLNPDEITIARLLKDRGYATRMVGKWHCGDQPEFLPTRHGFDEYYGLPYSNDMGIQGPPEKRKRNTPLPLLHNEDVLQQQPDQRGLTERYTEQSVRFIREQQSGPFFLYLAHMYVHVPLFVPQRFMEQSKNGGYGGAVECIDWVAGVIFHELERLGLDDSTIVIFTSDNGSRARDEGGSNAPLRGRKGQTWEGGQRVPCIVRWPGNVPAGQVCDELTTSMDFLPTLARIAGTTEPQDRIIDGKDVAPLWRGDQGATSPHETLYHYLQGSLEAVRKGKWKLRVAGKQPFGGTSEAFEPELYDLENDLGETTDVAADNPGVVAELRQVADAARHDLGDTTTDTPARNARPIGKVDDAKTLCTYDENHPYIVAAYDKPDMHRMGG